MGFGVPINTGRGTSILRGTLSSATDKPARKKSAMLLGIRLFNCFMCDCVEIGFYKGKYQIVNPTRIVENNTNIIDQQNKYSLTEGLSSKKYNIIINNVLNNLPDLDEWHRDEILRKFDNVSWTDSIINIHN